MPGRPMGKGNRRAAKLTGEQVLEIRFRYANEPGCTQGALARRFEVSIGTIANIVNGLTWQSLVGSEGEGGGQGAPVDRPPLNPRQPEQSASEASLARLQQRIWVEEQIGPKDLGPSDQPSGAGISRLEKELEKYQSSTEARVVDGLEQLEKGKGD